MKLSNNKDVIMNITVSDIENNMLGNGVSKSFVTRDLKSVYSKAGKCRSDSFLPYGFNDYKQYANSLYYMIKVKEMTRNEAAEFFDIAGGTAYGKIKKLGLYIPLKIAQENIIKRQTRSYESYSTPT